MRTHTPLRLDCSSKFYSGSGTGNTFLITELPLKKIKGFLVSELNKKSIDSGLVIETMKNNLYRMHVIEKDGSESSFCGNGARVVAHYLYDTKNITLGRLKVDTNLDGILFGKRGEMFFVDCGKPITLEPINIDGYIFSSFNVCGEPHLVTSYFFNIAKLARLAWEINRQTSINVSCINNESILTYERGVNNVTKSCGSACVAATQYKLIYPTSQLKDPLMRWDCPGGTNYVDINNFSLIGESFLDERLMKKTLSP